MTEVVAALIWDGDRFLACQRPAHKARGLLWEFVGGKVEPGETLQDALCRECREELDVTIGVGEMFMSLVHEYPDLTVRLTLFNAWIAEGTPKQLEHNDLRWITTDEIDQYEFCPADEEILKRLKRVKNGLQAQLLGLEDSEYKSFQCSLMPTVDPENVIGIRMPILRKLTKRMEREGKCAAFLASLPHQFYEENNIHGILISHIQSCNEALDALDRFLPWVDNWATCDLLSPDVFKTHPPELLPKVRQWLKSKHPYTVRFGISVLMKYYLDADFSTEHLDWVAEIDREEYYIRMMQAWYFATALAKQSNHTLPLLQSDRLSNWVRNKTIQKAVESRRISGKTKNYLKTLRK